MPGNEPAGFVILDDESLLPPPPERPGVSVWRFMVNASFQHRGIGRATMLQGVKHVRARRLFTSLQLSCVPGPGCPEPFCVALGFRHTGRADEGEVVLELPLQSPTAAGSAPAAAALSFNAAISPMRVCVWRSPRCSWTTV